MKLTQEARKSKPNYNLEAQALYTKQVGRGKAHETKSNRHFKSKNI
jgi:hypothetical protein